MKKQQHLKHFFQVTVCEEKKMTPPPQTMKEHYFVQGNGFQEKGEGASPSFSLRSIEGGERGIQAGSV